MDKNKFYDKIRMGNYHAKLPYPSKNASEETKKKYHEEVLRCSEQFKRDCIKVVGLQGHPKEEKAYALALDYGFKEGKYAILMKLEDIADLLLND
jgi:hypothetical protein